jgi:L-rhamnose isomerase
MKITRIEIEGPNGTAALHREDRRIVIAGTRLTRVVERRNGQGVPVGEAWLAEVKQYENDVLSKRG